jgi:Protein tyrosine and serine/threonine kinase
MGRVKLFSFGTAFEDGEKPFVDSVMDDMPRRVYCAPEVILNANIKGVTVKADVYAFGMLLWEILVLKQPLQSMTYEKHLSEVVHGKTRPHLSKHMPVSLQQLMGKCWTGNSSDRLSMKEVHDNLEGLLLEGIELTVRPEEKTPAQSRTKGIIHKKEDCEGDDDGIHDGKSVRSADQTARSRESDGSKETKDSKEATESDKNEKDDKSHRHSRKIKYNSHDGHSLDDGDEIKSTRSKESRRSEDGEKSSRSRSKSQSRSPRPTRDMGQKPRSCRKIKYEKDKHHDDPNESRSTTSRGSNRSKGSSGSKGSKGSRDSTSLRRHSSRRGTRPSEEQRKAKSQQETFESSTCNETSSSKNTGNTIPVTSPLTSPNKNRGGRVRRSASNDTVTMPKKIGDSEEGVDRQVSRRKSFDGILPSKQASARFASPKRVRRRLSRATSAGRLVTDTEKDDADRTSSVSPSSQEARRRVLHSLSPASGKPKDHTVPLSSRQLMKGKRTEVVESKGSNEDLVRRAPGRSKSNDEKIFSKEAIAKQKQSTLGRRKSEILLPQKEAAAARSEIELNAKDEADEEEEVFEVVHTQPSSERRFTRGNLSKSRSESFRGLSGAAAGRQEGSKKTNEQNKQSTGNEDEIFPEFAGSSPKKAQQDQPAEIEEDDNENRRGKLKATPNGGLIQANSRDLNVGGSKAREKFISEHQKQQQLENGAVAGSLRDKQRRQQYNQSVAAAAAAGGSRFGSRRDLTRSSSNRLLKGKSKRSLSRHSSRKLSPGPGLPPAATTGAATPPA